MKAPPAEQSSEGLFGGRRTSGLHDRLAEDRNQETPRGNVLDVEDVVGSIPPMRDLRSDGLPDELRDLRLDGVHLVLRADVERKPPADPRWQEETCPSYHLANHELRVILAVGASEIFGVKTLVNEKVRLKSPDKAMRHARLPWLD